MTPSLAQELFDKVTSIFDVVGAEIDPIFAGLFEPVLNGSKSTVELEKELLASLAEERA